VSLLAWLGFRRREAEPVKLIAGLGNPGRSYAETRHNVGWWVVDHLADVWHFERWRKDHDALVADGRVADLRVRLMKPQTYMNLSGSALRPYLRRATWKHAQDLLVVVDDVALPIGRFRMRANGSAGGHNGLASIEDALDSREYARLRVGVGPPPGRERRSDLADYVLDRMGKEEKRTIESLLPDLVAAVETWVVDGADKAMSRFNRRETGDGRR
jgi:PTH1 family peptidyl-tRNA hydrolase